MGYPRQSCMEILCRRHTLYGMKREQVRRGDSSYGGTWRGKNWKVGLKAEREGWWWGEGGYESVTEVHLLPVARATRVVPKRDSFRSLMLSTMIVSKK